MELHETLNQEFVTVCCHCGIDRNLTVTKDSRVWCFGCEQHNRPVIRIADITDPPRYEQWRES